MAKPQYFVFDCANCGKKDIHSATAETNCPACGIAIRIEWQANNETQEKAPPRDEPGF